MAAAKSKSLGPYDDLTTSERKTRSKRIAVELIMWWMIFAAILWYKRGIVLFIFSGPEALPTSQMPWLLLILAIALRMIFVTYRWIQLDNPNPKRSTSQASSEPPPPSV